ncbi:hypothetical protein BDZ97DRAFT_1814582 [Flammula alnicola]|nr:hypothetical protein BDZ97DRAFT_1814582 [Flammula alnicola]
MLYFLQGFLVPTLILALCPVEEHMVIWPNSPKTRRRRDSSLNSILATRLQLLCTTPVNPRSSQNNKFHRVALRFIFVVALRSSVFCF